MRRWLLLVMLATSLVAACTNDDAPNPTEATAESSPSDEPESDEEAQLENDEPPLRSVDEMSDSELEAECYQGRREACDLLGH